MISPLAFWKFTRPHTILGTVVSVSALFAIATHQIATWPEFFWFSLLSAIGCNIFITGYNQLVDVELDRINKPDLPLASGELSTKNAKAIILVSLAIALAAAARVSILLLSLIAIIALIGFLYSWKNTYLKRSHPLAAAAITVVRGVLVNIGFYYVFSQSNWGDEIPPEIWLLTFFVVCFSLGIAWFKDIPDIGGDAKAEIASLALKVGVAKTFQIGFITVCAGYLVCAVAPNFMKFYTFNASLLATGSALTGLVFISVSRKVQPLSRTSMTRFYRHFWVLFAVAYLLFAAAAVPI